MRPSVIFGLALLNTFAQAKWQIDTNSCKKGHIDFITKEFEHAHKMALAGKNLLETKGKTYYEKFMSSKARETIEDETGSPASEAIKKVFQNSADLLNEKAGDIVVKITCDDKTTQCQDKEGDVQAHVIESTGTINLCDAILTTAPTVSALQKKCDVLNMENIDESFAFTLVHETMHFKKVVEPVLGTIKDPEFRMAYDWAIGTMNCLDLAEGYYPDVKRSFTPTQKDCLAFKNAISAKSKPSKTTKKTSRAQTGCHDEAFTMSNAETYAVIASGAYYTELCGHEIPLQGSSGSSSGSPKAGSPKAGSPSA